MRRLLLSVLSIGALLVACSSAPIQGNKVELDSIDVWSADNKGNALAVSGQPDNEEFKALAGNGFKTVIDLRTQKEDRGLDEAKRVEELGMTYISLPISGRSGISFENAAKLDELLSSAAGPVLAHCGSGNRVAALLALRASAGGASDEEAVAIGKKAGLTSLEPIVREVLKAAE